MSPLRLYFLKLLLKTGHMNDSALIGRNKFSTVGPAAARRSRR